ncbi:MAG: hypothetical protein ACYCTW_08000 [Sulfuricella sp.]
MEYTKYIPSMTLLKPRRQQASVNAGKIGNLPNNSDLRRRAADALRLSALPGFFGTICGGWPIVSLTEQIYHPSITRVIVFQI